MANARPTRKGTPGRPGLQPTVAEIAVTRERDREAVELALTGMSLEQIADELGWADKSGPSRAIKRALDRHEVEAVKEKRAMENARYDRLQAAWWPKALEGDDKAATVVLRIFERRARLNGLDQPQQFVGAFSTGEIPRDPAERAMRLIEMRDRLAERIDEAEATGDGAG